MSKSAILVDFDNIFFGLWRIDPDLALMFAKQPDLLLEALAERYLIGGRRRWLVARCYLNPEGYVADGWQENGNEYRHFFRRFRPLWVRAGFEVVDTPTLARDKNAADIRIVIDALDLLQHPANYEEFVIASGDSDFTPLLQRLRANDKAITILFPGNASRAYVSVADRVLNFEAIGELFRPPAIEIVEQALPMDEGSAEEGAAAPQRFKFAQFVISQFNEATAPINLSNLAQRAAVEVPEFRDSRWGGSGFAAAVAALGLPNARMDQYHLWDEERHEQPLTAVASADPEDLPELIDLLARTVDLPRLPSGHWPILFDEIAAYLRDNPFNLGELTRSLRDKLADSPTPVGRAALNTIVRGAHFGGADLAADPSPDTQTIARAFLSNLIRLAYESGVNIDGDDEREISAWLGIANEEDPSPPQASAAATS